MSFSKRLVCCWMLVVIGSFAAIGQSLDSTTNKVVNFPSKLFGRITSKATRMEQQLSDQTDSYLKKLAKREERLKKKLYKEDSTAAKNLFGNPTQQYAALAQRLRSDTGNKATPGKGAYLPYLDSLRGSAAFLQQNPQVLGSASGGASLNPSGVSSIPAATSAQFQSSLSQLQALQAKMQDADQIQQYVKNRKEQIKTYLLQHAQVPGLSKGYQGLNQDMYYYTQQVQAYKDMLNDPDKMEKKALAALNQLPAFQQFMKNNSQLAMLFGTPANYGSAQSVAGLLTRDQMQQVLQGQMGSATGGSGSGGGGSGGMASVEQSMENAQAQLDQYKQKLSSLGTGGGDVDIPDFKPNDQKTKTFLQRLEFGFNFQTTKTNYYPTTTDLGLSLGYRLGHSNIIGVGASYKLGWGSDIQHVALSNQGVGLRSFLDIKLKGSISATGGLEYNYATPFTSLQQVRYLSYWTQSGLIGLSKTVSVKSQVLKKTSVQLLWDFLSYQQVPRTQPILFRVAYGF